MKILLTGFEPLYGYWKVNSSWEAIKLLPNNIMGAEIIKLEVPLSFRKSTECLEKSIDEVKPDIIINVGQSGDSNGILVERIAMNIDDTDTLVPDNDGYQPIDQKIVKDGPDAYLASLPIKPIVHAIKGHGIPAGVSDSCGSHLCNHVMYTSLHIAQTKYKGVKSGFIHVPRVMGECMNDRIIGDSTGGLYFMESEIIAKALEYAIITIVNECGK